MLRSLRLLVGAVADRVGHRRCLLLLGAGLELLSAIPFGQELARGPPFLLLLLVLPLA